MIGHCPFKFLLPGMHPDKKTEELEQLAMLEAEKKLDQEETIAEIEEVKSSDEETEPIEEPILTEEEIKQKRKRDLRFEMALFFILGILIGITIKTEAINKITIGFDDYQLKNGKQSYDVEKIKADLLQQAKQVQAAQESAQPADDAQGTQTAPSQPSN